MYYRADRCVTAGEIGAVFGLNVQETARAIGGAFLEEGQYLFLERGKMQYRRAEEGDLRKMQTDVKKYQESCKKLCVPFLYVGMLMPVE